MRDVYVEALKSFVENGHVQEKLEPDYLIAQLKNKGVLDQAEADQISAKNSRLMRQKVRLDRYRRSLGGRDLTGWIRPAPTCFFFAVSGVARRHLGETGRRRFRFFAGGHGGRALSLGQGAVATDRYQGDEETQRGKGGSERRQKCRFLRPAGSGLKKGNGP